MGERFVVVRQRAAEEKELLKEKEKENRANRRGRQGSYTVPGIDDEIEKGKKEVTDSTEIDDDSVSENPSLGLDKQNLSASFSHINRRNGSSGSRHVRGQVEHVLERSSDSVDPNVSASTLNKICREDSKSSASRNSSILNTRRSSARLRNE